jgi:type IV pilus assembly protein PilC
MKNFAWNGLKEGKKTGGLLTAKNKSDVLNLLKDQKIIITNIKEGSNNNYKRLILSLFDSVSSKELMTFTKSFSVMLKGGLSIIKTLDMVIRQQKNIYFRNILDLIKNDIESGETLSKSFAKHPNIFDNLYVSLLAAGESSGRLDFFLDKLSKNIERNERRKSKLKKGTMYPSILIFTSIAAVILMMVFVVPVFVKIYANSKNELPQLTELLIQISNFIKDPAKGGVILICAFFLFLIIKHIIKTNQKVLTTFHKYLLKVPVLGNILIKDIFYKLFLVKGDLIGAGVSVVNAIEIAQSSSRNLYFQQSLGRIKNGIICGEPLSKLYAKEKIFPYIICELTTAAEETGKIEEMFQFMATCFEEEFNYSVDQFLELLEPLGIIIIGIVIGFILLALYLPIFQMGQNF